MRCARRRIAAGKVIVPRAPGQATDIAARVIAERLEMAGFLAREQERYAQIIKADNIRLE